MQVLHTMELQGWTSGGMGKPNPAGKVIAFEQMDDGSVFLEEDTEEDPPF
jgi:hypothetical protein